MKENKLFTQEAVSTALKVCALGSIGLANPRKLAEALTSLPEDLGKMVMASIMAGHMTLIASKARASKVEDSLEQEVLKAIEESPKERRE